MHSVMIVSDEASLEEVNQLLTDEGWWVHSISPGSNGSWMLVLSDQNPDAEEEDEEYEEDEAEEEEEATEYEH